jgi:5-methylcytosine-specific restriction endonuclease McrA
MPSRDEDKRNRRRNRKAPEGRSEAVRVSSGRLTDVVVLPCLRCGANAVLVGFFFQFAGRDTIPCRRCEAMHYLAVRRAEHGFGITYQRYTLRYALEFYDEDEAYPIAELAGGADPGGDLQMGPASGPIMVYSRKTRFTRGEVEKIWRATGGLCHLCRQRRWRIDERGARGWHIDHIIPHIGGGVGVERLPNFRVACAQCNLTKGRGYAEAQLRLGLRKLVEKFEWPLLKSS